MPRAQRQPLNYAAADIAGVLAHKPAGPLRELLQHYHRAIQAQHQLLAEARRLEQLGALREGARSAADEAARLATLQDVLHHLTCLHAPQLRDALLRERTPAELRHVIDRTRQALHRQRVRLNEAQHYDALGYVPPGAGVGAPAVEGTRWRRLQDTLHHLLTLYRQLEPTA